MVHQCAASESGDSYLCLSEPRWSLVCGLSPYIAHGSRGMWANLNSLPWLRRNVFFLPCCHIILLTLNPCSACSAIDFVICFNMVPGQGWFYASFSELKRLTEKSICYPRKEAGVWDRQENKGDENLSFCSSKLLRWLIIPYVSQNQAFYDFVFKVFFLRLKKSRNRFLVSGNFFLANILSDRK